MDALNWIKPKRLLVLLTLPLFACNSASPLFPKSYDLPPLPVEARQPSAEQTPLICSQGCSPGLTKLRENLLGTLTQPTSQDSPASAATKR